MHRHEPISGADPARRDEGGRRRPRRPRAAVLRGPPQRLRRRLRHRGPRGLPGDGAGGPAHRRSRPGARTAPEPGRRRCAAGLPPRGRGAARRPAGGVALVLRRGGGRPRHAARLGAARRPGRARARAPGAAPGRGPSRADRAAHRRGHRLPRSPNWSRWPDWTTSRSRRRRPPATAPSPIPTRRCTRSSGSCTTPSVPSASSGAPTSPGCAGAIPTWSGSSARSWTSSPRRRRGRHGPQRPDLAELVIGSAARRIQDASACRNSTQLPSGSSTIATVTPGRATVGGRTTGRPAASQACRTSARSGTEIVQYR